MGDDGAATDIRSLSPMRVARVRRGRYNACKVSDRVLWFLIVGLTLASVAVPAGQDAERDQEDDRPEISVRARPASGVSPARIVLTAELVDGADDYREYYCPTVVWEWGDDTTSESTLDCEAYEPGASQIRRRHTIEHVFERAGRYRIYFRLKQRSRVVSSAFVVVNVLPGGGGERDFSQ
jgi:hypothetical protein